MKINITPEMRIRMMQAETIEIDVPDTQAEFVGLLRQQLLTQDGRCTADPLFVVFSKREIAVDLDHDHDRVIWWHKDDNIEACERATRWLNYRENTFRDTGDWVKLAIKEIDQFETACFTEQGCKDYLAVNGHNLRKPFIYAHSLFRNREMLELRKMLMAEQPPRPSKDQLKVQLEYVTEVRDVLLSALESMMRDDGLVLLMRHDQIERNRDAIAKAKGGA